MIDEFLTALPVQPAAADDDDYDSDNDGVDVAAFR